MMIIAKLSPSQSKFDLNWLDWDSLITDNSKKERSKWAEILYAASANNTDNKPTQF